MKTSPCWLWLLILGLSCGSMGCRQLRPCWPSCGLPPSAVIDPTPPARTPVELVSATEATSATPPEGVETPLPEQSSHKADDSFRIPRELPGADAPPLRLPPLDAGQTPALRRSLVQNLFPDLPELTAHMAPAAGPPVDLAELQQLATDHSPLVRQALAEVARTRGLAVQAGLYPNPVVGYEGDTLGTARTAGYNGIYASQQFITAGKLTLAQNVALMEVRAAEHAARRAQFDLANAVRRNYFKVLLAQEQLAFNTAMAQLAENVYKAQIDLVAGGEAAAYEPLQLRVLAIQARNNIVIARNNVAAAWGQLAATLGMPELAYPGVAGSAEGIAPDIELESARAWMLAHHTDLAIAQAMVSKAATNVRLQQVTPIPDLQVYSAFQKDDTTTLNDVSFNVQVGVPVPLFNRNQGNIAAACAEWTRANQNLINQRNELLANLSEAYGRYASNVDVAATYRSDILADQVRVYRGVYDRFRTAGEAVDFSQVVVAQQTLAQVVTSYLQTLSDQWTALVDVAHLMQVNDLFGVSDVGAIPVTPPSIPEPTTTTEPAVPPSRETAGEAGN